MHKDVELLAEGTALLLINLITEKQIIEWIDWLLAGWDFRLSFQFLLLDFPKSAFY